MTKFQSKTNYNIVKKYPVKIQVWKSTKSHNSKSMMPRVIFLVHCTCPQWDLSTWSFILMPCIVLKLCSGQKRHGRTDRRTDWPTSRLLPVYATLRGHKTLLSKTGLIVSGYVDPIKRFLFRCSIVLSLITSVNIKVDLLLFINVFF